MSRKPTCRCILVDDRDGICVLVVLLREAPPGQQGNRQRFEVTGCYGMNGSFRRSILARSRPAFDRHWAFEARVQRRGIADGRVFDTSSCSELVEQAAVDFPPCGNVVPAILGNADTRDSDAFGSKS